MTFKESANPIQYNKTLKYVECAELDSEAGCFRCHAELWTMYMSSMISWFNGGSGGMAGEPHTSSKTYILPEEEPSQMLIEFLIP